MKNIGKILLSAILLFSVFSCSSTTFKLSSIKNNKKKIAEASNYIVFCDISDIGLRTELEKSIVQEFAKKGKTAKESINLFPPLKEYDPNEIKSECLRNNIYTKLQITPINSSSETGYMLMYGVLIPLTEKSNSFDIIIQDFKDDEMIMRSSLNTEGDLKNIVSKTAVSIVDEILNEECKEYIPILDEELKPELTVNLLAENKWTIMGEKKDL